MNSSRKLAGAGLLAAFAASLCCLTPVLALLVGTSSLAASFNWMAPLRPYLMGLTASVLGFAWYQQLKPQPLDSCGCEPQKKSIMQTKSFLSTVTLASLLLLTFPSYSSLFYQGTPAKQQPAPISQQTAYIRIKGMSCESCEHRVKQEISKLKGISTVNVSYAKANATVKYDNKKTSLAEIKKAVDATGYKVVDTKNL